ncbi:MAG: uncharacterized protein KVP18_000501 [Porospora cf. gigantea A]|uniref:uncharacterized protein n=1 Tax=Porospora cf. gigantea A TaxID=2853593 RepID=UPI003559A28A|nr:MAG: hypothetical protein KVP18_000501 [Porospora cf. gigantea A]
MVRIIVTKPSHVVVTTKKANHQMRGHVWAQVSADVTQKVPSDIHMKAVCIELQSLSHQQQIELCGDCDAVWMEPPPHSCDFVCLSLSIT